MWCVKNELKNLKVQQKVVVILGGKEAVKIVSETESVIIESIDS